MKILGREPALIIGFLGAAVTVIVALGIPGVNAGQGAAISAFLSAVIIAVTTRPVAPALFTACISAGAALFAEYGLHASDALVAAITGLTLAGFSLFGIRPQVSPASSDY